MITDDRICRILYALWVCGLQVNKDPDFVAKTKIIKDIMNVLGVEGMEGFDAQVEEYWKRHHPGKGPFNWNL